MKKAKTHLKTINLTLFCEIKRTKLETNLEIYQE